MITMNNSLVSIIIPTYNRSEFILQSLQSVFEQTYRPIELVIVDDGSTDNTSNVIFDWIKKHSTDQNFTIIYKQQDNSGAPSARNQGYFIATGRYIQYLDSDDKIEKTKIHKQINLLQKENTSICLCDYYYYDYKEKTILKRINNNLSLSNILKHFVGVHTSVPLMD